MISLTSKWPSMTYKTETDSCFSDPYPDPGWSWTRMSRLLPRNSANAISLLHLTSEGSWWLLLCPKISAQNTESSEWHVIFLHNRKIEKNKYQEPINVVVLVTFKALCDDSKQSMKPCPSVFENLLLMSRILNYDFEGHDLNETLIPILILLAHTYICLRKDFGNDNYRMFWTMSKKYWFS